MRAELAKLQTDLAAYQKDMELIKGGPDGQGGVLGGMSSKESQELKDQMNKVQQSLTTCLDQLEDVVKDSRQVKEDLGKVE